MLSQEPVVGSAQDVVVARARAPRDQPYSIVSSASALSIRILSSRGALGRSYSSRVYFRKLHHALRMRRSTSMERPALWLTSPPRYNSFVCLHTWPAASTLNTAADSGIPFARIEFLFIPTAIHIFVSSYFLLCICGILSLVLTNPTYCSSVVTFLRISPRVFACLVVRACRSLATLPYGYY